VRSIARSQKGATFIEILLVAAIGAVLFGFVVVNLFKVQHTTAVGSIVNTLLADIKNQQIKAMAGATEGRVSSDSYGIYFQATKYILFHGTVFNPNDSANLTINLDPNLSVATTFSNNTLIFLQKSGEVSGFASGQNTVSIQNTAGNEQKTMIVNRYGVIISIN